MLGLPKEPQPEQGWPGRTCAGHERDTAGSWNPLIIEAAINGATVERRNPNVARQPAEVAADALACLEAGAAIVHNHTDDDVLGHPTGRHDSADPTGRPGSPSWPPGPTPSSTRPWPAAAAGARIEDRYAHFDELDAAGVLGMAVADPGSVNLAGRRADGSVAPPPHPYENSPADIDWMFAWCRSGTWRVHVSIFEPGFLRLVLGHLEAGTLPAGPSSSSTCPDRPPTSACRPSRWGLDTYLRLLGDAPLPWMVGVPSAATSSAAAWRRTATERGGHVRVGLEDFGGPTARRPTNADLVAEAVALAGKAGRPVATPDQARAALGLPPARS